MLTRDELGLIEELVRQVDALEARVRELEAAEFGSYRGTSATDFTTTELPRHGDYGYQTTDAEVQMNCNGTVRAISTAAL